MLSGPNTEYSQKAFAEKMYAAQAADRIAPPSEPAFVEHLREMDQLNGRLAEQVATLGHFADRVGGAIPECATGASSVDGGRGMVGEFNMQTDRLSFLIGQLSSLNDRLAKIA